jgi:retinol dehydrogenase-12
MLNSLGILGVCMTMDKKIILITGANRGVGFETALQLAQRGALVVMVSRDRARGAVATESVARVAIGPAPVLLIADLSLQASIRELAGEVSSRFARIDVLINNAGAIFDRRGLTEDGIEKTFAVNHLAPFLLTNLIIDLVQAAPSGRIVTVASESYSSSLDFDNLQGERHYNFFQAYRRSKLANILFTYELARRLANTRTTANCVSPGPTLTGFGNDMKGLPELFPVLVKRIPFLLVSPKKGAEALIYAASEPHLAGVSGRFFLRSRERPTKVITYKREVAERLWAISAQLCAMPLQSLPQGLSAAS